MKNDDGDFFVVVVPTDTTKDVKIKIQSQKGYSLAQQNLKVDFGGIKMDAPLPLTKSELAKLFT